MKDGFEPPVNEG